jgi:hypothetical protein
MFTSGVKKRKFGEDLWDVVKEIRYFDNKSYYVETTDGGVYDDGNIEVYPELLTAPIKPETKAEQLIKNWQFKDRRGAKTSMYRIVTPGRARSEAKYHDDTDMGSRIGEVTFNGKVVGTVSDFKNKSKAVAEVAKIIATNTDLQKGS